MIRNNFTMGSTSAEFTYQKYSYKETEARSPTNEIEAYQTETAVMLLLQYHSIMWGETRSEFVS